MPPSGSPSCGGVHVPNAAEPSYPFRVWSGLLTPDHVRRISFAVWTFLWMIRRTTTERSGEGLVLGGTPVKCERIAQELGFSLATVTRDLRRLRDYGYIRTARRRRGLQLTVFKSKRRPPGKNGSRRVTHDHSRGVMHVPSEGLEESSRTEDSPQVTWNDQDMEKRGSRNERAIEETNSKPPCCFLSEDETNPRSWAAIAAEEPFGPKSFRKAWEVTYSARKPSEQISATMERCIIYCQDTERTVPSKFYELKRAVEKHERKSIRPELESVARMLTCREIRPKER